MPKTKKTRNIPEVTKSKKTILVKEFNNYKNFKTIAIVSLVLLIFISLGIIIYFYIYKNPQRIIKVMQRKMTSIKTLHYKSDVTFNVKEEGGGAKINFNVEGDLDEKDKSNTKYSLLLNINGDYALFNLNTSAELKSIDKDLYFRVTKIPSVLSLYGDFSGILNRWAKSDTKKINYSVSKLLEEDNLFLNSKIMSSEKINGVGTYHFETYLNKELLLKIYNNQQTLEVLTPAELERGMTVINSLSGTPIEIWIGRRDNYLYRVKGSVKDTNSSSTNVDFILDLTKFDDPVNIETPENFETIEAVFGSFWENFKSIQNSLI